MAIHVACGSWADAEYVGVLYPKGLPPNRRLSVYAQWFNHVEVNSTYYATPRENVVSGWDEMTPPGFSFCIKLQRAFSQNPEKSGRETELLTDLLAHLQPIVRAKKLSTFLLVMDPHFTPDRHQLDELDVVVEKLRPYPLAVELRHIDWVTGAARKRTLDYFRERNLVWVALDLPQIKGSRLLPAIDEVTNPQLAYLRLHGRNPLYLTAQSAEKKHTYAYSPDELKKIAARVRVLAEKAENVQVVANNHAQDFAPKTALALQELLGLKPANAPVISASPDLYLNFGD